MIGFTRFRKNISEIGEFKSNIAIKNGSHERHSIDRKGSSNERIKGARIMSNHALQLLNNKHENISQYYQILNNHYLFDCNHDLIALMTRNRLGCFLIQ